MVEETIEDTSLIEDAVEDIETSKRAGRGHIICVRKPDDCGGYKALCRRGC